MSGAKVVQPTSLTAVLRVVSTLIAGVGTFDACFWGVRRWGMSEAAFFLGLAILILFNRRGWAQRRSTLAILALLVGAAVANVIEPGICNSLVWLTLMLVLAGDTYFANTTEAWGRWLSQVVAMMRTPGRPFWLASVLGNILFRGGVSPLRKVVQALLLSLPAVILVFFFGSLLAQGNAIFGVWTQDAFRATWQWLAGILNPWRILLWFIAAGTILPLLRPVDVAPWWWKWTRRLPRWPETSAAPAIFSSGLTLGLLNVLFVLANLSDAIFLWHGAALPPGVTCSQFVHHGVEFLIATVLLSAVLLTAIFQQELNVAGSPLLKILAYLWIVQNVFLIASVALRLARYIQAYDMTVARLGLIIFLMLVAAGYALLFIKVAQDRSLSWLVGGCLFAAFATFYITQFLDLAGWTADYNVTRWEKGEARDLDTYYISRIGSPGWPALRRATQKGWTNQAHAAAAALEKAKAVESETPTSQLNFQHWREFNLQAWVNRNALAEAANN